MVEVVEVGGGSGGERAATRSVLSHFLFQLLELALRVRELLSLRGDFPLGPRHRLLNLLDGDFGIDDGLTHLPRERAQIGRGRRIDSGAERVPQALEQDQLLRMVFAKKSEKTGSTARDLHSGHAGRLWFKCCAIVSVRENCASHAVQRYS